METHVIPNRCSGCEHYDGQYKLNVNCALKVKTTVDQGCGSFSPDNSASCDDCYYNENPRKGYEVTCSKYRKFFPKGQSKCEDYAIRWEQTPTPSKKKGCFVSTVVCEIMQQDDDCYILSTLRRFRDNVLLPDPKTSLLVYDYYDRADPLVELLKKHPYRRKIAEELFYTRLTAIVSFIEEGKNEKAISEYMRMISYLESMREKITQFV